MTISRSLYRPTGRGLFTQRAAAIADSVAREKGRRTLSAAEGIVTPPSRYEARLCDKGWLVWDQRTKEPVVSFEGRYDRAWAVQQAEMLNAGHARAVG